LTEENADLKVASYILFRGFIEDCRLGDHSQITLRNCSKEVRKDLGYICLFAEKEKKKKVKQKIISHHKK